VTPARRDTLFWLAQRTSAAVLALCLLVHLAVIIYAVRSGLTAAEILGRTRGNAPLAAFYGVFVIAVSVHAPLGLRAILSEWTLWRSRSQTWAMAALAVLLFGLGMRAVWAVVQ